MMYKINRWLGRHKTIVVFALSVIAIDIWTNAKVFIAENSAEAAFHGSRGHNVLRESSPQFISHGIQGGMTLDLVDQLLQGAVRAGPTHIDHVDQIMEGVIGSDPTFNTSTSYCLYTINYGSPIPFSFGGPKFYISEDFCVFFDKTGRVIGLRRQLYRNHGTPGLLVQFLDFSAGGQITSM